jgi:hypothetical protein
MCATLPIDHVALRCDRCARDLGGSAPVLAFAGGVPQSDRWVLIDLGQRRPTRASSIPTPPPYPGFTGAVGGLGGRRVDQHTVRRGRGLQLACRRCSHRPRVAYRHLLELAVQAAAAGRRDAYV